MCVFARARNAFRVMHLSFSLPSLAFSVLCGYRWVCNVLYKQYLHIKAYGYASASFKIHVEHDVLFSLSKCLSFFACCLSPFLALLLSPTFAKWNSSYNRRAAEVLFLYSEYCDVDTVFDVLCITRQVDSLLSRSSFPTSSLQDLYFLHLSLLNRWWCAAAQRSIAQQRSDNNESGTNWIGLWPTISWRIKKKRRIHVINRAELWSRNVRNVRFPIRKINGVIQLSF